MPAGNTIAGGPPSSTSNTGVVAVTGMTANPPLSVTAVNDTSPGLTGVITPVVSFMTATSSLLLSQVISLKVASSGVTDALNFVLVSAVR